ncbi:MAG: BFO_1060 family glycosyltransferase [Flavobacteriales bacterium]
MKSQPNRRAFCFLVSNEPRDFYLLLPIIYFLETYLNFEVTFEFVWDADKIRRKRPELVLLPNTRGHALYYEIGNYCLQNQIPLFAHDSEGNFNTEIPYDYWAFNQNKAPLTLPIMTWNSRVKNFLIARYQLPEDQIVITGAPGFDKYQYLEKKDKAAFLTKYGHKDKRKIIGYAGWAFGKLENKELHDLLSNINKCGAEGEKWLEQQRDAVESALRAAIEKYPDFLFVLKKHPRENFESDLRDSRNEMNRLVNYPNVLYLKDEEEIQDLIEVSDLWLAFESTSIMEAWLLAKPTLLINPDIHFTRADLYKGTAIVANSAALLEVLQQFADGDLSYFEQEQHIAERQKILANAIGFTDGLNHLRALSHVRHKLEIEQTSSKRLPLHFAFFKRALLLHLGKFFFIESLFSRLPKFKKTVWLFKNRQLSEVKTLKNEIYPALDHFYSQHQLKNRILSGQIWEEL